jgi:hypothetical protein
VRLRRTEKRSSLTVVFNYVDTLHFYSVHLSSDLSARTPVHNGIFVVKGRPWRSITGNETPPALPDLSWHTVRIIRDVPSGEIKVFMDGKQHPIFSAVNRGFTGGQIGLGSFGNTGDFTHLRLRSRDTGW